MKKNFPARRVPRKIGTDEDEEPAATGPDARQTAGRYYYDCSTQAPTALTLHLSTRYALTAYAADPAVKRPSTKPRKSSSLRQSFGPSAVDDGDDDTDASVVTPKRGNLSRVAIHKNIAKRSSLLASQLPKQDEDEDEEDRPSYSAASLRELRDSTPATPKDFSSATNTDLEDVSEGTQALDLSSKFGSSLARYQQQQQASAIPSAAEIAEKKARRARLAKEQQAEEFISLDPDDPNLDDDEDLDPNVMRDEQGRLVLKPKQDKYDMSESRLARDDEDVMENFDDFTEDGRISLGRKAEAEAARKRKQEMATQIAEAEGGSDGDSDDSDRERNAAFEAAQTRHGAYGQTATESDAADQRPKTPPIITPLPTLDGAIERLRRQLAEMQSSRMQKLQEMESLQREKIRLAEEEVRIQRALKETAEKFEALRKERGIGGANNNVVIAKGAPPASTVNGDRQADGVQAQTAADKDQDGNEAPEEDERPSFGGGGFGAGLGFNSMTDKKADSEDSEEDQRPAFGGLGFGSGSSSAKRSGFGLGFRPAQNSDGNGS